MPAYGHPVRLPSAHDDGLMGAGMAEPGRLGADEQIAVLTAAMGELGAERAFAVRQGIKHVARHEHIVGAGPAGQAEPIAVLGLGRAEIAGVPQPVRQPQVRRQAPEAEDQIGAGLLLSAQRAARASPDAVRRRRPETPRSRRPSPKPPTLPGCARTRCPACAPRRSAARSAAWQHAPRTRPAPRRRRDCRPRSAGRSPDADRVARYARRQPAPAPAAWRGHRCKCRLPPETSAHSPPDGASASKRPQLSQATALRWRSLGRCRRPKNVMVGAYLKLGRNRNAE